MSSLAAVTLMDSDPEPLIDPDPPLGDTRSSSLPDPDPDNDTLWDPDSSSLPDPDTDNDMLADASSSSLPEPDPDTEMLADPNSSSLPDPDPDPDLDMLSETDNDAMGLGFFFPPLEAFDGFWLA